jgi:hypothetical protein
MNQEINAKLNDIGTELHLRPSQIERLKKAVSELVCSTVPEAADRDDEEDGPEEDCWNDGHDYLRTEILKKWGKVRLMG